jgi:hypothetical protein
MAVGINCYSVGKDHGRQPPELFAEWFTNETHVYQQRLWPALRQLASGITTMPFMFAGLSFPADKSGVYLTNAVKVYIPDNEGKRADQLSDDQLTAHCDQWRDELDALAVANAFPHLIAIIGEPFWKHACASFQRPQFEWLRVDSYESCAGRSLHYANRIVVGTTRGAHSTLLVRLRHPAGRSRTGSPSWLLRQPDFIKLASARQ